MFVKGNPVLHLCFLSIFLGHNWYGNRQSFTGITWNGTGAEDGKAGNLPRRGLSHQQPVPSFHKSGIVIPHSKPKSPFWMEGGSLALYKVLYSIYAALLTLPSGSYICWYVLLLRTCASKRIRSVLQPSVRLHHLLRVQLPREPPDLLSRICGFTGAGPAGHAGSVQ